MKSPVSFSTRQTNIPSSKQLQFKSTVKPQNIILSTCNVSGKQLNQPYLLTKTPSTGWLNPRHDYVTIATLGSY